MRLPDVAAGRDDIARCDVTAGNDVTAGAGRLPSGAEDRLRPGTAADNFDALSELYDQRALQISHDNRVHFISPKLPHIRHSMVLMYRSTGATIGVCADVEWLMAVLPIILRH